jgi:hypothetical protein
VSGEHPHDWGIGFVGLGNMAAPMARLQCGIEGCSQLGSFGAGLFGFGVQGTRELRACENFAAFEAAIVIASPV